MSVFCDVSQNIDYDDGEINSSKEFTEPTLSVRYKFVIRPAKEIAERIKASGANDMIPFIKEDIYVPENSKTINIQLGQIANNYAWYDEIVELLCREIITNIAEMEGNGQILNRAINFIGSR